MTNIKKIIAGFLLMLLFTVSAFASNITTIAIKMNECFSYIEKMARYEHENNEPSANNLLKKLLYERLNSFNDILLDCEQTKVPNFKNFAEEVIRIAFELKDMILLDFKSGNYIKDYNKSLTLSSTVAEIFAIKFDSLIDGIYDYLEDNNVFSEKQYYDFTAGFNKNTLLSENEQKALFNSLIQCKIEKQ
jgi:hypothetical protein